MSNNEVPVFFPHFFGTAKNFGEIITSNIAPWSPGCVGLSQISYKQVLASDIKLWGAFQELLKPSLTYLCEEKIFWHLLVCLDL
jgi:hypothetical protein